MVRDAGTVARDGVHKVAKQPKPENPFEPTADVLTSTDTAVDRGGDLGPPSKLRCEAGATMKTEVLEDLLFGWCETDGQRQGPVRAHDEKKRLVIAGAYDKDGRAGAWRFFDGKGREVQRDVYRGPYVHRTRFGPDGEVRFEAKTTVSTLGVLLAKTLPSLPATYYDERGTKRAVVHFLVTQRHGPATYFDEKGRPVITGHFVRGEPAEDWKNHDPRHDLELPGQDLYDPVLELELDEVVGDLFE